jgi:hypothetical protein
VDHLAHEKAQTEAEALLAADINETQLAELNAVLQLQGVNDVPEWMLNGLTRIVKIEDGEGSFDEVIAALTSSAFPVHLNTYSITNGKERIDFSGIERETLVNGAQFTGRHAHDSEVEILNFGDRVSFTTTSPTGVSDLGTTGLRVIASEIDMQSEVRAGHIIFDSLGPLTVTKPLMALNSGYMDLRTYSHGTVTESDFVDIVTDTAALWNNLIDNGYMDDRGVLRASFSPCYEPVSAGSRQLKSFSSILYIVKRKKKISSIPCHWQKTTSTSPWKPTCLSPQI